MLTTKHVNCKYIILKKLRSIKNKAMTVVIIVGIKGLEFCWLVGFMKKTFLGHILNS